MSTKIIDAAMPQEKLALRVIGLCELYVQQHHGRGKDMLAIYRRAYTRRWGREASAAEVRLAVQSRVLTNSSREDCRAQDPAHCRTHGTPESEAEDAALARQEEREKLESILAENKRLEELLRKRERMESAGYAPWEVDMNTSSVKNLDMGAVLKARERMEARLAELDVEDKLDEVEPVELSFTAEKKSGAEWVADAQQYFMEHYSGRTFAIGDTGHTLHVGTSNKRAKLATKGANTQKRNESFKQLENVITRAVHISSEEPKAKEGQGKAKAAILAKTATFEKYGAPATINGEKCLIWFNAQTKEKGAKDVLFYEFGVTPLGKKKG